MGIRVTVTNDVDLGKVRQSIFAGLTQGLNKAAEHVLAEAIDRVPVDQGDLRLSGAVTRTGNINEPALVSFDTPYAARLHEHPEYNFSPKTNANAQGKWLENAAVESKDEVGRLIRDEIKAIGGQ